MGSYLRSKALFGDMMDISSLSLPELDTIKRPLHTAASPQILAQLTQICSTHPPSNSHSKGSKYAASIKA